MINHFRTTLANQIYDPAKREEHIPKDYIPKVLPPELQAFHDLVFASAKTKADILQIATNIVALIASTTYRSNITKYDNRLTLPFDNYGDSFTFTVQDQAVTTAQRWDALALHTSISNNETILRRMLASTGTTKRQPQQNPVYDLADILVCFVDRLNTL